MAAMTRAEHSHSDLAFDRRLNGELSPELAAELDAHLAGCVRCRLRFEVLQRQREAFLARAPDWAAFSAQVASARRPRRSWLRWIAPTALAAGALLALVVSQRAAAPTERSKGGASIGLYIKRGEHVSRGVSGDLAYPGDRLRFTYSSALPTQFALFDLDAHGTSVVHPLSTTTVALPAGREVALDFGLELDAQLGDEQLVGVFCARPHALAPLRAELAAHPGVPALSDCQVDRLILRKVAR